MYQLASIFVHDYIKEIQKKTKKQAEKDEIVEVFAYDRWNRIRYPSKLVNIIFLWNCFHEIDFHR